MPGGRNTVYEERFCEEVVEHCQDGSSLTSFAAQIGVSRTTITNWGKEHEEFLVACARAKAASGAWWEKRGREIAMTGGGPGAAQLAMFGMKNMGAEDWKEAAQIDHTSSDRSMSPTLADFYGGHERGGDA